MTAIVTGSNRGIGKETAKALAKAGAKLILACRNAAEAEKAAEEIRGASGNGDVRVLPLDLASPASIAAFVKAFKREYGSLNVLVNNAGISTDTRLQTEAGLEINIGTNYFGTYALTMGLLPLFEAGAENRIVNLSSDIHSIGGYRLDRLNGYRWFKAYAVSKLMILQFTAWLAREAATRGIKANAVHPGVVRTSIMFTGKWYDAIIRWMLNPMFVEPAEGAKTSVQAALGEDVGTGGYYSSGKVRQIPSSGDAGRRIDELIEWSARTAAGIPALAELGLG